MSISQIMNLRLYVKWKYYCSTQVLLKKRGFLRSGSALVSNPKTQKAKQQVNNVGNIAKGFPQL